VQQCIANLKDKKGYRDAAGRFRNFHALRHTCGSWLADCGVHPKQIQEIMRHKDINLTMTRYGHSLRGRQAEAVAKLPDLSLEVCQVKRATGADDSTAKGPNDLARNLRRFGSLHHALPRRHQHRPPALALSKPGL
jgi:hypothetical protein